MSPLDVRNQLTPSRDHAPFHKADIEQSIVDRFEQQVRKYPERLAVKAGPHRFTYQEVNEISNRVARSILDERGREEEPVAVLLPQGVMLVAAILGALKAGKIYVPMDPSDPTVHLERFLDDSQAGLILTDGSALLGISQLETRAGRIINVDEVDATVLSGNLSLPISPNGLACIYYTSGSTGSCKGVVDNHSNVLHNIMRYTNSLRIGPEDRLTMLQSSSFSGSVSNLFSALLNGASVFPIDLKETGIKRLREWLNSEKITIYHSVPVIFEHVMAGRERFPNLRVVRLEGDAASAQHVELFQQKFGPGCLLVNGLGATETGLTRQFFIDWQTKLPNSRVPIGYPTEDMDIRLLDENGKEVPSGQIGEITVNSRYLAVGYWCQPELTRSRFRPLAEDNRRAYRTGDVGRLGPDGCLEYLGRRDHQLKIKGQWIDLQAAENALMELDTIKQAVVMPQEARSGDRALVAYIIPKQKPAPLATDLRRALEVDIPAALLPTRYVTLEALPLDAHGKVDRKSLPAPSSDRPAMTTNYKQPGTATEKVLAGIWSDWLGVDRIGVHDNFLDLGGDSLAAMRIVNRIRQSLHVELSLGTLFDFPTVAELANLIERSTVVAQSPDVQGFRTVSDYTHD